MKEKTEMLVKECSDYLNQCNDLNDLNRIKIKYLGKNGLITALLKNLQDLPSEQRPFAGKTVNDAREKIQTLLDEKEGELKKSESGILLEKEWIDVTLPGKNTTRGSLHPITKIIDEIISVFSGLGFEYKEGPEIETDYYCFQALNIPKDHPARDMQDTFYINENIVLRSHTSPVQVRNMEISKPPIRIVNPGRVYRADDDATHSPMFHQIEGLCIDEHISLGDLKGVLEEFAKNIFSKDTKIRFRPSYFPFTEPSVEVDVSCSICKGKGCKICKGTGWIEILGAGIVNPAVLEQSNIDSKKYSGFAFGCGIERIAMIKYGIDDMRILFDNDLRFLRQYK